MFVDKFGRPLGGGRPRNGVKVGDAVIDVKARDAVPPVTDVPPITRQGQVFNFVSGYLKAATEMAMETAVRAVDAGRGIEGAQPVSVALETSIAAVELVASIHQSLATAGLGAEAREAITGAMANAGLDWGFDALESDIRRWQAETFPKATAKSCAIHLLSEAVELARSLGVGVDEVVSEVARSSRKPASDAPAKELGDVVHMAIAVAMQLESSMSGCTAPVFKANKAREWGEVQATGIVEHVAPPAPTPACNACGVDLELHRGDPGGCVHAIELMGRLTESVDAIEGFSDLKPGDRVNFDGAVITMGNPDGEGMRVVASNLIPTAIRPMPTRLHVQRAKAAKMDDAIDAAIMPGRGDNE